MRAEERVIYVCSSADDATTTPQHSVNGGVMGFTGFGSKWSWCKLGTTTARAWLI